MSQSDGNPSSEDPKPGLPILEIGAWSCEKHDLLRRYIGASSAARRKFSNCSYIDLFCGPGRVRVRNTSDEADGGAVVAWRQAADTRSPFMQVIVGDLDASAANSCGERLTVLGAPVSVLHGAAESTVEDAAKLASPRGLHLAYLDPYNLGHLPFSVIERLAKFKSIDILVHFSVMDLQREIDLDFDRDASRFESFAPGWRDHVDVNKLTQQRAREEFIKYWLGLVNKLGFSCSREKPLLTNSNNGPLYRMMFLMRHKLAEKLWNDIAKPTQSSLFNI
jgi:three-Cys-motif partner protein